MFGSLMSEQFSYLQKKGLTFFNTKLVQCLHYLFIAGKTAKLYIKKFAHLIKL